MNLLKQLTQRGLAKSSRGPRGGYTLGACPSHITLHDVIRAITFLLEHKISGPVNLTSPNPVTNQEFTSALARAMHRPALFPAPAIALKIALGGFSSEVLGSKKVIPQALTDAGFTWDYPHITNALNALIQE